MRRLVMFAVFFLLLLTGVLVYRHVHSDMPADVSCYTTTLTAQEAAKSEAAIQKVLDQQAADWNRGDLANYATGYKNSPDIVFVGSGVRRGYSAMLEGYKRSYSTPEKMGRLTFSNVEVHLLDATYATVLGNFKLERTLEGGGNAAGIFSLVMEQTGGGWKIILDHSASTTPTANAPQPFGSPMRVQ